MKGDPRTFCQPATDWFCIKYKFGVGCRNCMLLWRLLVCNTNLCEFQKMCNVYNSRHGVLTMFSGDHRPHQVYEKLFPELIQSPEKGGIIAIMPENDKAKKDEVPQSEKVRQDGKVPDKDITSEETPDFKSVAYCASCEARLYHNTKMRAARMKCPICKEALTATAPL